MVCVSLKYSCDITGALITAGNLYLAPVGGAQAKWFPGSEELLAIDAMSGPNYSSLSFERVTVELVILSPTGCLFVMPGAEAPFLPFANYEMEVGGDLGHSQRTLLSSG